MKLDIYPDMLHPAAVPSVDPEVAKMDLRLLWSELERVCYLKDCLDGAVQHSGALGVALEGEKKLKFETEVYQPLLTVYRSYAAMFDTLLEHADTERK